MKREESAATLKTHKVLITGRSGAGTWQIAFTFAGYCMAVRGL